MKTGLFFVLLIVLSISLYGQQKKDKANIGWGLVYSNDENGNRLEGNLENLITLIRNGESVRISWIIEHPTNKSIRIEHFADARFITIMSDSIVFAQIDPIVGQTPSIKDKFITLKENIEWSFSASSLGKHDSMNLNASTGVIIDHKPLKFGIKWFARTR